MLAQRSAKDWGAPEEFRLVLSIASLFFFESKSLLSFGELRMFEVILLTFTPVASTKLLTLSFERINLLTSLLSLIEAFRGNATLMLGFKLELPQGIGPNRPPNPAAKLPT